MGIYLVCDISQDCVSAKVNVFVMCSLVAADDETAILRDGYWASYNIPFFEVVYNMSGYPEVVAREGPDASYQLCPRAKIFRRDESKVTDMESMQYIMRYNGTYNVYIYIMSGVHVLYTNFDVYIMVYM